MQSEECSVYVKLLCLDADRWNRWVKATYKYAPRNNTSEFSQLSAMDEEELVELRAEIGEPLPELPGSWKIDSSALSNERLTNKCFPMELRVSGLVSIDRFSVSNASFDGGVRIENSIFKRGMKLYRCYFDSFSIENTISEESVMLDGCEVYDELSVKAIEGGEFSAMMFFGCEIPSVQLEGSFGNRHINFVSHVGDVNFIFLNFSCGGVGIRGLEGESVIEMNGFRGRFDIYDVELVSQPYLDRVCFYDGTRFEKVNFRRWVDWSCCTFQGRTSFKNAVFELGANFDGVEFSLPPEFHGAEMHQDISFTGTRFKTVVSPDASASERAWRTLKHAMSAAHNRERELEFFGYEMKSKAARLKESGSIRYVALDTYGLVSNYGQSIIRPFFALIGVLVLFGLAYKTLGMPMAARLSLASTFPYFGFLKNSVLSSLNVCELGLVGLQITVSTILLFLIGLGIRNQFMMK